MLIHQKGYFRFRIKVPYFGTIWIEWQRINKEMGAIKGGWK